MASPAVLAALGQLGSPTQAAAAAGSLLQRLAAAIRPAAPAAPGVTTFVYGPTVISPNFWQQFIASVPVQSVLTSISSPGGSNGEVQIGVGPAGAETIVARFALSAGITTGTLLVPVLLNAGERVALRQTTTGNQQFTIDVVPR